MSYDDRAQRQKPFQGMRDNLSMVWVCCRIINAPLQALSRRAGTCGCRFFGVPALLALIAVPLICAFVAHSAQRQFPAVRAPGRHFDTMPFFLLLYLVALLGHRIQYAKLHSSQKASIHSQWGGTSMWTKLFKSERTARLYAEPISWAITGLILRDNGAYYVQGTYVWVGALGTYFLIGALALFIEALLVDLVERARMRAMQDAQLENAYFATLYQRSQRED